MEGLKIAGLKSLQIATVIVILVILWLLALPSFTGMIDRAERLKVGRDLSLLEQAEIFYRNSEGGYTEDIYKLALQLPGIQEILHNSKNLWEYKINAPAGADNCSFTAIRKNPFSSPASSVIVKNLNN